jgi:hypothetical protein
MIADLRQESYKQLQRIEALEAAQQPDQIAPEPEWQQLSEREPQVGDRCAYRVHPSPMETFGIWSPLAKGFWTSDKGLFYGDPECISWRIAMPQQPAPATEESTATAPPAPAGVQRRHPSPATIAECGGPRDSQGPEACDCGLLQELNPPSPAPAVGLVERVHSCIVGKPECGHMQARAAIREVAAWLEEHDDDLYQLGDALNLLEQEANR